MEIQKIILAALLNDSPDMKSRKVILNKAKGFVLNTY